MHIGKIFRTKSLWKIGCLFLLGVGLMELESIFHHTSVHALAPKTPFPFALLEKLGEAFVIASVLALAVDAALKRELLEEVTRDALAFAAGHTLPDPVKATITNIIQAPYARKGFTIKFTLTDLPEHPNFVELQMHTSYDVINLKDEGQAYCVRTAIEKSHHALGDSKLVDFLIAGSSEASLNENQLKTLQMEDSFFYFFDKSVTLKPAGGIGLHVQTTRSIIYPENWYYVLDILEMTMGVKVEFFNSDRFFWDVHFGGKRDFSCQNPFWTCPSVFLPGQFVRVTWKRKVEQ